MPSSIAASASLTSVPNSNWATTSAIEFADVDWTVSSRGTPEMARSIGSATCSATSCDPAPGYGAIDGDDRELDVRQELLLEAAPRRDAGDEQRAGQQQRDAPLADGQLGETVHE